MATIVVSTNDRNATRANLESRTSCFFFSCAFDRISYPSDKKSSTPVKDIVQLPEGPSVFLLRQLAPVCPQSPDTGCGTQDFENTMSLVIHVIWFLILLRPAVRYPAAYNSGVWLAQRTTKMVPSHPTVARVPYQYPVSSLACMGMQSSQSTHPIHSFSNMNMAAMSTATFQNDKGTILPIAHYPTGPASDVHSTQDHSKIASPGPLGLFAFACTNLTLSLYSTNVASISTPNVIVGMCLFCGGLAQFVAGMWEFPRGNLFGATVYTIYSTFWMSYAVILIPGSGVASAYETTAEFKNAVAIYFTVWSLLTFLFVIPTLRTNVAMIALFVFLGMDFGLAGISEFHGGSTSIAKAGGVVGIITSCIAAYIGLNGLLSEEEYPIFSMPLGAICRRD